MFFTPEMSDYETFRKLSEKWSYPELSVWKAFTQQGLSSFLNIQNKVQFFRLELTTRITFVICMSPALASVSLTLPAAL